MPGEPGGVRVRADRVEVAAGAERAQVVGADRDRRPRPTIARYGMPEDRACGRCSVNAFGSELAIDLAAADDQMSMPRMM